MVSKINTEDMNIGTYDALFEGVKYLMDKAWIIVATVNNVSKIANSKNKCLTRCFKIIHHIFWKFN